MTAKVSARTERPATFDDSPRLVVVFGPAAGRKFVVGDSVVIGRGNHCEVQIDDNEVSRRHCRITRGPDGYIIEDLGSRNGTTVSGAPVAGCRALAYGDRIQLGRTALLLFTHHDPLKEALLQRQKMEALGQLGAGIAHDLNNLLGVLTASMQHLETLPSTRTLADGEVRECHRDLSAAIHSARDLTKRLLGFARRGEHTHAKAVDVGEVIADVEQLIRRSTHHNVRVVTHVKPGLGVRGDRAELHQALMNLCLNARDAMPDGGTLTITLERTQPSEVPDLGVLARGPLVSVTVSDTGVGMDEQTRERAFEPFYTTKQQGGGSGLGLSTVYEIVTSHGGQVTIESTPGGGSTFRIVLPMSGDTPIPQQKPVAWSMPRHTSTPATGIVMLVDDQELVRRAASRLLRAAGHEVVCVGDGRAALARYYTGPKPDVVILDLDMPDMTGDECWRRLREMDPGAKCLFLSGSCDDAKRKALLREGALGFLEKPVDAQVLRDAVQSALER